jgi:prepilin-type N-terminal cleavage/methylation domain-containing protein
MSKLLTKLRNNKKKGFTLVELLVVIAIIGVLMAIIIPLAISFMDGSQETTARSTAANIYSTATAYQTQLMSKNLAPITSSGQDLGNRLVADGYLPKTDFVADTTPDTSMTKGQVKIELVSGSGEYKIKKVTVCYLDTKTIDYDPNNVFGTTTT